MAGPLAGDGETNRRRKIRFIFRFIFFPLRLLIRLCLNVGLIRNEERRVAVTQATLKLRQWSSAFDGLTIAFLTDLHCSPWTPPDFLAQVIAQTNQLKPDVILLGGDYVTQNTNYVPAVVEVLSALKAPSGVYFVLGNHDHRAAPELIRNALTKIGFVDVDNSGQWLTCGDARLRIAGVGDLRRDHQDLRAALSDATEQDAVILLSHNPDYAMTLSDPRVRLVLSGHTHGGQIILPRIGPPVTNSMYGSRLLSGLIHFGTFQLYVSRGIGTVGLPLRYNCPPEITLLTLT